MVPANGSESAAWAYGPDVQLAVSGNEFGGRWKGLHKEDHFRHC